MRKLLLSFLVVFIWGCQEDATQKTAYIHGQIVNIYQDYIVLSRNNVLIDTIPLNESNTFSYVLKNVKEGLYTFTHHPESQTIYIVPEDSILFRLNTLAFDETLYFSGTSADKNNLLMELFLLNEKNNNLIFSYFEINPKDFADITDSILEKRKAMFLQLQSKHEFSEKFTALAKKSIQYEFYDLRERYAFLINKYFEPKIEIPTDFFAYRKDIDFNDESLQSVYVYQRFLDNYLKNRSIEDCGDRNKNRDCYNLNDFHNLKRRILLVDSLFTLDVLKSRFYKRFGRKQIIFSHTAAQIDSTLNLLSRLGFDGEDFKELKTLAEVQRSFFIGNNISDKKLINAQLCSMLMKEILTKPTITFFWTTDSPKKHQSKHKKIKDLRIKYPEINFIGINIDAGEPHLWENTISQFGYDTDFEFQIRDIGSLKNIYKNYLNKILFINKKGEIIFGDIPLSSSKFENYIVEFLNQ